LDWIESREYYIPDEIKGDKERVNKILAYQKKEWLSALLETKDQNIIASYKEYDDINPREPEHPGFTYWSETSWGTSSPLRKPEIFNKTNKEIAQYLSNFKEKQGWKEPTKEGLSETLQKCVAENPGKFAKDMKPFLSAPRLYQSALLYGLSEAWHSQKDFAWKSVLNFMFQIIGSDTFWNEKYKRESYNYRNWIISHVADLIEDGTKNDNHAFDAKLLPKAEQILLLLAQKTESNITNVNDLVTSVLNSSKGRVFSAMINYSLRYARLYKKDKKKRWVKTIKEDFNRRLKQEVEPSLEFSVILGKYLANLYWLDKKWVIDNINRIFLKDNDIHWKAAFTGYLFYSRVYKDLYFLLRKNEHYAKAIKTEFSNSHITERLVQHICVGYIEGYEKLNDNTSLISKLIENGTVNQLSAIVSFFWMLRNKLTDKIKAKVKPIWKVLFELLSQNQEDLRYQKIISNLSRWLSLIDKIDKQVLEWLKLSAKYSQENIYTYFFIEYLLKHVAKTPAKVGEIYLEMLNADAYPEYKQENIQAIVRILYEKEQKEIADRICNLYRAKGFDFLTNIYEAHKNDEL